jgi:hypothetical protein
MSAETILKLAGGLIASVGALFALDARYLHQAEAADIFSQQQQDSERDRLELELDLKQHELEWLLSLDERDEGDEKKISYLERAIDRIEQRLLELD